MRISDKTFLLLNVYLSENAALFEKTDYLFIVLVREKPKVVHYPQTRFILPCRR